MSNENEARGTRLRDRAARAGETPTGPLAGMPAPDLTAAEVAEIEARAKAAPPGLWLLRMRPETVLRLLAALRVAEARAEAAETLAKAERAYRVARDRYEDHGGTVEWDAVTKARAAILAAGGTP